jgi:hypothetical protein
MPVKSMELHKKTLRANLAEVERLVVERARIEEQLVAARNAAVQLTRQILRAEKLKRKSFDAARFKEI